MPRSYYSCIAFLLLVSLAQSYTTESSPTPLPTSSYLPQSPPDTLISAYLLPSPHLQTLLRRRPGILSPIILVTHNHCLPSSPSVKNNDQPSSDRLILSFPPVLSFPRRGVGIRLTSSYPVSKMNPDRGLQHPAPISPCT